MGQLGQNVDVGVKLESALNTAPGVTGAELFRYTKGTPGLSMSRALIESNEVRKDMMMAMARMGSKSVGGSLNGEISDGSYETFLEATMRSTWTAEQTITEATGGGPTSVTTTTSTIVGNSGSWITAGVRVGDIIRPTNFTDAGNNNINLRVTGLTATTITVAGTPLTLNASPDSSFTITILKKLVSAATPTRRSFWIEQYYRDIDVSHFFGGCRFGGFSITGNPNGMATIEFRLVGIEQTTDSGQGGAYYTTPTEHTSIGLTMVDSIIRFDGADVGVSAFTLNYDLQPSTQPLSGTVLSADVYDNEARLSGSVSMNKEDAADIDNFGSETEIELHAMLVEPEAEPKTAFGIFIPRLKLTGVGGPIGNPGPLVETKPFTAGPKDNTSGYDQTNIMISVG